MWNTWRVLPAAFFVVVSPNLTRAVTASDQAVFNVIHGADPTLVHRKVLYRNAVAPDLDLVIAIGSPAESPLNPDSPAIWWDEKQKLGLFLQERAHPNRVYSLALAAGSLDCGARIERATPTDTVISCTGEKSYQGLNQKFVYDIRAKALVSHFAYQPFAMMRVLNVSGHTVFVGSDLKRLVAVEFQPGASPEFRIQGEAEAAQWLGRVKTAQEWIGPGRNQILYVRAEDHAPIRFGPSGAFTFVRGSIVDSHKHCQSCHRPGEAGPFSLLTYKDARPWAKAICEAVQLRKMPPWFADPAHGEFANDRRMSPTEISTIVSWVDSGATEGKLADAPPPLQFTDDWKIGKPDLILTLPVDFQIPATGTIDYTWFATDMKLTEDKWIEKLEVRPSNRGVVHHALVFARPPGNEFRKDLQPGGFSARPENKKQSSAPQSDKGAFAVSNSVPSGAEMIGDYVVNGDPFIAGPGQARMVRAGSHMLFQMHYTANGHAATDRTRVGIVFAKIPPKERIVNDAVSNATIRIPPGAPNHEVRAVVTFQADTAISGFGPHMHVRGKAMRYELIRADTKQAETLLYVPAYNFNWQLKYVPKEWVHVRKGDQLRVTAWYDNSANNPFNPDPSREVLWGDQSWDEMLFAFFDFVIPAKSSPDEVTGGLPKPAERASR